MSQETQSPTRRATEFFRRWETMTILKVLIPFKDAYVTRRGNCSTRGTAGAAQDENLHRAYALKWSAPSRRGGGISFAGLTSARIARSF